MDEQIKVKLRACLSYFETGSIKPNYGAISVYFDGKGKRPQITFGCMQTTEESGLKDLLKLALEKGSKFRTVFKEAIRKIETGQRLLTQYEYGLFVNQRIDDNTDLSKVKLLYALRESGKEEAMQKAQIEFFDSYYLEPSLVWANLNGFVLPLSKLVIYDSFIHSGRMRSDVLKGIKEKKPIDGGNEKEWIKQYVQSRHNWLTEKSELLKKTTYRTRLFMSLIEGDNWNLDKTILINSKNVIV
jgi:chitosanase